MANGDLIKLGSLSVGGNVHPRPTRPWSVDLSSPAPPGEKGNIQDYRLVTNGTPIEIVNSNPQEAYQLYWREVTYNNKKLLICDRVILVGVSWTALNNQGLIYGKDVTIDGKRYKLRTMYVGSSIYDSINEWDQIIRNQASLPGLPTPSAADLDNSLRSEDMTSPHNLFWNWAGAFSWGVDSSENNPNGRVYRGYFTTSYMSNQNPLYVDGNLGWRPVLELANSAPTVTLTTSNNVVLSSGICTLSGTVSDPDGDAVTVSATIAGITKSAVVNGSGSWSLSWLVSELPQAQYSNVTITATDGKGGTATTTYTGTITIDKTNPSIAISGVAQGQTYASATPIFSATDAGGAGLQSCTATLNGSAFASGTKITTGGSYTLIVTARDQAGNSSTQTVTFTVNTVPTVAVTTADNQVLIDGGSITIEGSTSDVNSGDVITVKYKVNNGTIRNIASGVASGTPLSFAKNLTFSNKRMRDGSTEVTGDLAENVDHIITVWTEDDKGGKSAEITRKFRVIHNRPPTISGENENLGVISAPPSKAYSATDPEGNMFAITEKINGITIRSFAGTSGDTYTLTIPYDIWIRMEPGIQHTMQIEAMDSSGMTSVRTYTFARSEDRLEFKLKQPFETDIAASRILVTLDAIFPAGAVMKVEACNNGFDTKPFWEDMTNFVRLNRGFIFTNKTKTSGKWGVDIRFTFEKGTATTPVIVNGFGGAFD